MNKRKTLIIIIAICIAVVAGTLGFFLAYGQFHKTRNVDGYVVPIRTNVEYTAKMITTYEEYEEVINENRITVDEDLALTEKDLEKNDYIIDYIPYDKKLKISDINVEILENGVVITYYVNEEVEENDQMLLYMIPIDKGKIKNFTLANRTFSYENEK